MGESNGILDQDIHGSLVPVNGNGNGNGTVAGSPSGSSGRSSPNDFLPNKLFVGGLSWQTTETKLKEYFGSFGTVTDAMIMKDPDTGRSRGFGFVTFAEPGVVETVIKAPKHMLDGKNIDPKHATPKNQPKQPSNKTKKSFVGGVSQDTSVEEMRAYFSQFGKVEDAALLMDPQTKRHRGFGFVTFDNEDVVDHVVDIKFHTIKNKKVECKKAQPKEITKLQNNGQLCYGKRVQQYNPIGMRLAAAPMHPIATPHQLAVLQAHQHAIAALHAQHAQSSVAAAAAMSSPGGYGKVFGGYPQLTYRYSPYPIPAMSAGVAPMAPTASANPPPPPQAATPGLPPPVAANYQGYNLTNLANVDMSSFQGVDWSTFYGMYGL